MAMTRIDRLIQAAKARRLWCALGCGGIIVGFAVLFYGPVFFRGQTVAAFDLCYFQMPAFQSLKPQELQRASNLLLSDPVTQMQVWDLAAWQGPLRFPWLWNPYAAFGTPFMGNAQSALFNPLKHLAYALGMPWGFGWLCFLKMALAGLFMAAYLGVLRLGWPSRLLGALSFMACGFMVVWAQFPHASAAIFLPLVLLACEYLVAGRYRSGFILLAGVAGFSVLSGHPETSFHEIIAGALYLVCRHAWPGRQQTSVVAFADAGPEGPNPGNATNAVRSRCSSSPECPAACRGDEWRDDPAKFAKAKRSRVSFAEFRFKQRCPVACHGELHFWRTGFLGILLFAGGVLLGALIASIQILPTAEYLFSSAKLAARAIEAGLSGPDGFRFWDAGWLYAYRELLAYIVPATWGNPSWHDHWWNKMSNFNESAGYVGVGVLLMAILAWRFFGTDSRIRALCLLQLLALGFILKVTLIQATVGALPILNVTANKRFLLVFCFANAALAAILMDELWKGRLRSRKFGAALIVIILLMIGLAGYDYFQRFAHNPYAWIRAYGVRQGIHCLVFLLPFSVLVMLPAWPARVRTGVVLGLAALTAIDLWMVYYRYNPFIDCDRLYPVTPAIRWLQASGPQPRVLPVDTQIGPNMTTVFGIQDARLYDAVTLMTYDRYMQAMGAVSDWHVIYHRVPLRLASLASIRWFWGGAQWRPEQADLPLRYRDEHTAIYENTNAVPRAFVVGHWTCVASLDEAIQKLTAPDFPWRSRVVMEPEPRPGSVAIDSGPARWAACLRRFAPCVLTRAPSGSRSPIDPGPDQADDSFLPAAIVRYEPMRVDIQLPPKARGLLVLNDTWYPGWKATVDGKLRPIYRVNGVFRGVAIGQGDQRLVFKYRPFSFGLGVVLSGIGVLVWGLLLVGFVRQVVRSGRWYHPVF